MLTRRSRRCSTKPLWTRERLVTRSIQMDSDGIRDGCIALKVGSGVMHSVKEADPSTYREAIHSVDKSEWKEAMQEEIWSLESHQVWKMVVTSFDLNCLHKKWVYKTRRDADRKLERYKLVWSWLQRYLRRFIGDFKRKMNAGFSDQWRVPAQHGDIPNADVKAG